MALIQCPNCGKQISDNTIKCLHCGHTINKDIPKSERTTLKENKSTMKYIGYAGVAIVSIVLIFLISNSIGIYEGIKGAAIFAIIAIAAAFIYLINHDFRIGIRQEIIDSMTEQERSRQMTHDINVIKTILVVSVLLSVVLALVLIISFIDL